MADILQPGAKAPDAHCLTSATTPLALFPFPIPYCSFGGVCNHAAFPERHQRITFR